MKPFLSWKVLFGLLLTISIIMASLIISGINNDRNRAYAIIGKLKESVQSSEKNNKTLNLEIDSMARHLAVLTETVEVLEAQKDSLKKGIRRPTKLIEGGKKITTQSSTNFKSSLAENDTLYLNCQNTVTLDIPPSARKSDLKYSAKGASIEKTKDEKIYVIPKETTIEVTISNGRGVIMTKVFHAKQIPKPRFVVRDETGKMIDLKKGLSTRGFTSFRVTADADPNFTRRAPNDAIFRLTSIEVILVRGNARVATLNATSELVDCSSWRQQVRPGDKIRFELKNLVRRVYLGEKEKVDIQDGILILPIN